MKKLNTRKIRLNKVHNGSKPLKMLTCYDYQSATLLNETNLDLILVGDSLGNVILGYETTVEVSLTEMKIFGGAVKRGAKNKFVVVDMPFGTYASVEDGVKNGLELFQETKCEAVKLEGAYPTHLEVIERLTQNGVAVMGHIGLTPQSVHELGGYYTHGKTSEGAQKLLAEAKALEKAGCFAIVLECVQTKLSEEISKALSIPTIGIGSGLKTDGQVLVLNDLLHLGKQDPPGFCQPVANLYEEKKELIESYLEGVDANYVNDAEHPHH